MSAPTRAKPPWGSTNAHRKLMRDAAQGNIDFGRASAASQAPVSSLLDRARDVLALLAELDRRDGEMRKLKRKLRETRAFIGVDK